MAESTESASSAQTAMQALASLADAVGAAATAAELERVLPMVTRALRNALDRESLPDLGETEPATALRYDIGSLVSSGGTERRGDGSS